MAAPVPSLAGKRCFVTGAASGIGQATALAAAERGADLYLTDIAAPGLEETAAAIRAAGGRVSYTRAAGLLGLPWHAPYSAAKFGLRGVSEVLRFDLRPHRIGVSLVCPGGVKTPLVGTVEIVGIDNDDPEVRKMKRRFERHAVSPEHVAEKILAGIERNRYLVFTSADIRLAFWLQRWFPPAYEAIMRALNRRLVAVAGGP